MWLFKRKFALIIGLIGLAMSCGFEPVYQNHSAQSLKGKILLPNANSTETYAVRETLVRRFGEGENPEYRLDISYSASSASLGVRQVGAPSRYRITANIHYHLQRLSGETLGEGDIRRIASYNLGSNPYTNAQSVKDTKIRLAQSLGQSLANRVVIDILQE